MPAPAILATKRYAPSCNNPMSNLGTTTAPAALFFVVVDVPEELLVDPVPVGTLVTVPVPAVPAWLSSALQLELCDPDCVVAFPPKSQAVEALD